MSHRLLDRGSRWAFAASGLLLAIGCGGGGSGGHPDRGTGGVIYMVEDGNYDGLWRIDPNTAAAVNLGESGTDSSTDGLTETDDPDVLVGSRFYSIVRIRTDGSGFTDTGGDARPEALAYDPGSRTYFGILNNDVFTLDPTTGNILTSLGSAPDDVEGLTYGGPGILYGLTSNANVNGDLYRYVIATNAWEWIANTGVDFSDVGLAYDPGSNWLYAKGGQDSFLYRIDTATGQATVVGDTRILGGGGLAFVRR